ncbi:MAG: NADH-quinone oxidoreductase subunit M [Pseudomonadota bacterium]
MENLLSITTFIPALAALILAVFLRGEDEMAQRNARSVAMMAAILTFMASLFIFFDIDPGDPEFQFTEERDWLLGLQFRMGVDGISLPFVMLTALITPLAIAASCQVTERVKEYMIAILFLETLLLGVFFSLDIVQFFLFFEGALIPLFLIIGVWGGTGRMQAAFKMFLFTLMGSVLMLVAMIAMYNDAGTTDITQLLRHQFNADDKQVFGLQVIGGLQTLLFLAFLASFAVKLPIWPLHTWLRDAHTQAPIAGSVLLAAVVVKLGAYGLLRFSMPMFPVAFDLVTPLMVWLSVIAVLYCGLAALAQTDMRRVLAYWSVMQMGVICLAIFSANQYALEGALFHVLAHGLIIGALFLCLGMLGERGQSFEIKSFGGLACKTPVLALVLGVFLLAGIGAPGTAGFVGLFLVTVGIFQASPLAAALSGLGLVLSVAFALTLYRKVMLGDLIKESLKSVPDMSGREKALIAPLVILVFVLGISPGMLTGLTSASVEAMLADHETALAAAGRAADLAQLAQ